MTDHKSEMATALSAAEVLTSDLAEQGIHPLAVATAMLMEAKRITLAESRGADDYCEWRIRTVK